MEDLNDILSGIDIDVDVNQNPKKLLLNKKKNNNSEDIFIDSKFDNINIKRKIGLKVIKNKTKIFDSVLKYKKLKNINISNNKILDTKKLKSSLDNFYNDNLKSKKFVNKKINNNKNILNNIFIGKSFIKKIFVIFLMLILFYFIDGLILQNYINNGYKKLIVLSNGNLLNKNLNEELNSIKNDFIISDILIKPFLLIPNKNIKSVYYIIKGGKSLSFFINDSYYYYKSLNNNLKNNGIDNFNLIKILDDSKNIYLNFSYNLEETIYYFNKVGDLFNNETKEKFDKSKDILKTFYNYLTLINRNFDTLKNILGDKGEKKYLILLQNNDEIRPTGGFMGSLGLISLKNGEITNFQKDDIYAYEWEINKLYNEKIIAPEGINKIAKNLYIRDANYKIGFIESSYQIKHFLDLINKNIDGIIYINQNIVLDFLDSIGGVKFDIIGENVNSSNFSAIFSTLVESKKFKIGTLGSPKQVLFEFGDIFLKQLLSEAKFSKYLKIIYDNISSRDIVINSFNSEENSLFWKLGIDGTINYSNSLDFNYPVFMSIGGGKTDRYMIRNFEKNTIINKDCSINNELKIIQKHHFTSNEENYLTDIFNKFKIKDNNLMFIQGKTDNKQFIQVVLPKNSIIEKSNNYIIDENINNKIVKFYTNTRRLETISTIIKYKLINSECIDYNYIFYKQSGIKSYDLNFNINGKIIDIKKLNLDFNYLKK